jgi:hypothetical protein
MKNIFYLALGLMGMIMTAPAFGVTRFYLPSTGMAAEKSPVYSANWGLNSGAARLKAVMFKQNSAMTSIGSAYTTLVTVANTYCLCMQYVSDPIAPQTIAGTISGQAGGGEASNFCNGFSAARIKVVSNDGATERGVLLTMGTGATEFTNPGPTNRNWPVSTAATVVTAEAGDRIVIEVGFRRDVRNTGNVYMNLGDNNATDLPVDQTTTATNNPWIEFSQNIKWPSVSVVD